MNILMVKKKVISTYVPAVLSHFGAVLQKRVEFTYRLVDRCLVFGGKEPQPKEGRHNCFVLLYFYYSYYFFVIFISITYSYLRTFLINICILDISYLFTYTRFIA